MTRVNLRTAFLAGVLAALFAAVGSLFGVIGAAVALATAIVISFWSFWSAAPSLLARTNAVPCTNAAALEAVAELASRAGIPAPRIFEIADIQPNAFAIGANPESAVVILTSALCVQLSKAELRAVIAHEIAHIRNRDMLACTMATTFVGAIASLALLLGLLGFAARRNGGGVIILLAILAPLTGLILKLAMSRSIEYRADRDAAGLCGHPRDLISALRRLHALTGRIESDTAVLNPALASLFIVDPLPQSWLGALFSSHPPITDRIARLEASP